MFLSFNSNLNRTSTSFVKKLVILIFLLQVFSFKKFEIKDLARILIDKNAKIQKLFNALEINVLFKLHEGYKYTEEEIIDYNKCRNNLKQLFVDKLAIYISLLIDNPESKINSIKRDIFGSAYDYSDGKLPNGFNEIKANLNKFDIEMIKKKYTIQRTSLKIKKFIKDLEDIKLTKNEHDKNLLIKNYHERCNFENLINIFTEFHGYNTQTFYSGLSNFVIFCEKETSKILIMLDYKKIKTLIQIEKFNVVDFTEESIKDLLIDTDELIFILKSTKLGIDKLVEIINSFDLDHEKLSRVFNGVIDPSKNLQNEQKTEL